MLKRMLKKPVVAAIICVIVVVLSTVVSVRTKLNPDCDAISDLFRAPGGIADQLTAICDAGSGLVMLAEDYGIEATEEHDLCQNLQLSVNRDEPSSLMKLYSQTCARLNDLKHSLKRAELSEKDAALLEEYTARIESAQTAISKDPYNANVRLFLNKHLGAFSRMMARLCGARLPEQFA